MSRMIKYESGDFPISKVYPLKGGKKIFVVFSTYGEREADQIYEKLNLLGNELGGLVDGYFLSHRRMRPSGDLTEKKALMAAENIEIVNCSAVKVPDMGSERGKGADMRRTLYHISKSRLGESAPGDVIIVFLDADVVPEFFGPHFVLALAGAVLKGCEFAKAGFWRSMGRVKKFMAQPLFSSIKHPALDILQNLSYPLSGEVAGTLSFFNSLHIWQMYGIETGINIQASAGDYTIADVNLGLYDHEHHPELDIQKMSFGIIRTWLMQLKDSGIIELKQGAEISDVFRFSMINEEGLRVHLEYNLDEVKYQPLNRIL